MRNAIRRAILVGGFLFAGAGATPFGVAAAHAQEAPGVRVEAPSPSAPRDLVRLQNGGMLRGTLVESIPGERVTIQLPTGDIRAIPWSETTYVGPEPREGTVPPTKETPIGPRMERRSPTAMALGISALALVPISLVVAFAGFASKSSCEFDNRRVADPSGRVPIGEKLEDCSSDAIVGGLVGAAILAPAGALLLVYGVKKVPVESTGAVSLVPWTNGTNGAGGTLRVAF